MNSLAIELMRHNVIAFQTIVDRSIQCLEKVPQQRAVHVNV